MATIKKVPLCQLVILKKKLKLLHVVGKHCLSLIIANCVSDISVFELFLKYSFYLI